MSKHDYIPTKDQQNKIQYLMAHEGFHADWPKKFATHLAGLYAEVDHYKRAYEIEQTTSERAAIMLESYASEIQWLRSDIRQVVDQIGERHPAAFIKEAILLLTQPRSQREEEPAEQLRKDTPS